MLCYVVCCSVVCGVSCFFVLSYLLLLVLRCVNLLCSSVCVFGSFYHVLFLLLWDLFIFAFSGWLLVSVECFGLSNLTSSRIYFMTLNLFQPGPHVSMQTMDVNSSTRNTI